MVKGGLETEMGTARHEPRAETTGIEVKEREGEGTGTGTGAETD